MSASLLELKKKIAPVKQAGKTIQAIRMVFAAEPDQTEKKGKGYILYNDTLKKTVSHSVSAQIVDHLKNGDVPADSKNFAKLDHTSVFDLGIVSGLIRAGLEVESMGYLVVTGDRGLVSPYNSTVIKSMMGLFGGSKAKNKDIKVLAVGRIGT